MTHSTDYMLTSAVECERLERQADLAGRSRLLEHIKLQPGMRLLDADSRFRVGFPPGSVDISRC